MENNRKRVRERSAQRESEHDRSLRKAESARGRSKGRGPILVASKKPPKKPPAKRQKKAAATPTATPRQPRRSLRRGRSPARAVDPEETEGEESDADRAGRLTSVDNTDDEGEDDQTRIDDDDLAVDQLIPAVGEKIQLNNSKKKSILKPALDDYAAMSDAELAREKKMMDAELEEIRARQEESRAKQEEHRATQAASRLMQKQLRMEAEQERRAKTQA